MTAVRWDRVTWWGYVLVLAGAAVFIGHSFVGLLVLGLFGYYATRPLCNRLDELVDSDRLAAMLTVSTVLLPVLVVTVYSGIRALRELQERFEDSVPSTLASRLSEVISAPGTGGASFSRVLRNPMAVTELSVWTELGQITGVLNALFGGLLLLGLALTLAYGLLAHDRALASAFRKVVGGPDTTVHTYARAVDQDLESIFFGNLLFVVIIAFLATAAYFVTNLVAPQGLRVPMVFTLGFLTGVASLVPIIVGKVVYLPVVAYLGFRATQLGRGYVFVGATLVAYVLLLDLLPQSFVQPWVSGRQLHTLIVLFAYILGPVLFGWYGFFLLPILFVLMLEAIRIVIPELMHGEPIADEATIAEDTGATPGEQPASGDDEPPADPSETAGN